MPTVITFTEAGGHEQNEDAFDWKPIEGDGIIAFLADGQGGRANGGPAARLACSEGIKDAENASIESLQDLRHWASWLGTINRTVTDAEGTGYTTFIGLCINENQVVGVASGDSMALLVTNDEMVDLTAKQHRNPPVGSGMAVGMPFEMTLKTPWKLLMMSDGAWKYIGTHWIVEMARQASGSTLLEQMQQAARMPGNGRFQDDLTVGLIES